MEIFESLNHELRMEFIFAVSELYLPSSIFSITFSQMKAVFEGGGSYDVPALMDRLRQVAVDATLKLDAHGADVGLFAGSARPSFKKKSPSGHTSSPKTFGHQQPLSLKCSKTFCSKTGHLDDKCFKQQVTQTTLANRRSSRNAFLTTLRQ